MVPASCQRGRGRLSARDYPDKRGSGRAPGGARALALGGRPPRRRNDVAATAAEP